MTESESPRNPDRQYRIDRYSDEKNAEVLEDLRLGDHGYKFRMLEGLVMPPYITPDRYALSRAIETRTGDICFTSYPKSGSTWLSYVLLLITRNGEAPPEDTLRNCLQWVASSWPYPRSKEYLDRLESLRIFKSHMPYQMALGGVPAESSCRHIYIARNPKDVVVSYYHFESEKAWAGDFSGPWEHWFDMFLTGQVQRGDWFDHVLSWWEQRDAPNILFMKYEDLRKDFRGQLENLSTYLGYELSPAVMDLIEEKTSFRNMKSSDFSNLHEIEQLGEFFRKGKVGSWGDLFTTEQSNRFDRVCRERLAGTGLDFSFE